MQLIVSGVRPGSRLVCQCCPDSVTLVCNVVDIVGVSVAKGYCSLGPLQALQGVSYSSGSTKGLDTSLAVSDYCCAAAVDAWAPQQTEQLPACVGGTVVHARVLSCQLKVDYFA